MDAGHVSYLFLPRAQVRQSESLYRPLHSSEAVHWATFNSPERTFVLLPAETSLASTSTERKNQENARTRIAHTK
jgi:hypothetical protein